MDLPVMFAATVGLAALAVTGGNRPSATEAVEAPVELVGQGLWASEEPILRWGEPVRAEDLALERLGRVAAVVTAPDGTAQGIVVAVGGLWGLGAREVSVGMDRVHLLGTDEGGTRLVVDLSAAGAAPLPG